MHIVFIIARLNYGSHYVLKIKHFALCGKKWKMESAATVYGQTKAK